MKLGKIKTLCKNREIVELYTRRDGRQFLSDGCGVWMVDDGFMLDEHLIRVIFEVTAKKWSEKWRFDSYDFEGGELAGSVAECLLEDAWSAGSEKELIPLHEYALIAGEELRMFAVRGGNESRYIWASAAQFAACPDAADAYMLREAPDGSRAIAVYEGMLMSALVRVPNAENQRLIAQKLRELAEMEMI